MQGSGDSSPARRVDDAAFGAIYGAITVMGILAATDPATLNPLAMAGLLFTSVLAVALAKAYATMAATALKTNRSANWASVSSAWAHSRTVLLAVNVPTLVMVLSAARILDRASALFLAQVSALGLLIFYGARIGFRLSRTLFAACLGGAFTGAIGLAISLLKNLLH
ncbi:MAG: hypothetical protein AAFV09_13260 [Pseudomonadota bacterium]